MYIVFCVTAFGVCLVPDIQLQKAPPSPKQLTPTETSLEGCDDPAAFAAAT